MITAKQLTKRYPRTVAVDEISFEVAKGQIVGFLGPNGAGKTTTMRMLTCFLSPSAGTASVAGFDVLEHPFEVKKRIGYLPEAPPIYPEMETAEYLKFVGKLKGLSGADLKKRVDYVCDRCAVGEVKNKLLGKLSKGYRQRVGLAQAIIHNPDVLILDEPTAAVDPKQINETRDLRTTGRPRCPVRGGEPGRTLGARRAGARRGGIGLGPPRASAGGDERGRNIPAAHRRRAR